jgi:hypothetical protein
MLNRDFWSYVNNTTDTVIAKLATAQPDEVVGLLLSSRALRRAIREQARNEGRPLTHQALWDWRNLRHGVPPARVLTVARVTGIPPHRIRPDVFGKKVAF